MLKQLDQNHINLYNEIIELKKLIHTHIYPNHIQELIGMISNSIDLFNIEVNENYTITIKIKKTSIKKYDSYEHECTFYYNIINNILYNFFMNNLNLIDCIRRNNGILSDTNTLLNGSNISLFYNITTLGDNIVCIYL